MTSMTALERVVATVGQREPDRVPFFLLLAMQGARELGMSIEEYFSRGEHVAEAQVRMQARYGQDCLYAFFYASLETRAFGGETLFSEDGPPNAGRPILQSASDIRSLRVPVIEESKVLAPVLTAISLMKAEVGGQLPIIGVVMSPFSLPVMQLGFEGYLEVINDDPALFWRLMAINEEFCTAWANAQLAAGANIICYFDPLSSPTIIPKETYLQTGYLVAKRTLPRIHGPIATHLASGRCLSILDELVESAPVALAVSALESLSTVKAACRHRTTVVGNLNGVEMCRWTADEAEHEVKRAIAAAGGGGGFILSDNHGEIPWQVPETVLMAMSDAVKRWGNYPLTWIKGDAC
jgi:uroporphyrinogen decarboxylase